MMFTLIGAPSIPVPTSPKTHRIRDPPADYLPGRSYRSRRHPPNLWTVPSGTLCQRHAPSPSHLAREVGHWPFTTETDRCGSGSDGCDDDARLVRCRRCVHWYQPTGSQCRRPSDVACRQSGGTPADCAPAMPHHLVRHAASELIGVSRPKMTDVAMAPRLRTLSKGGNTRSAFNCGLLLHTSCAIVERC